MERIIHALTVVDGDSVLLPDLKRYVQVLDDQIPALRALQVLVDLLLNGIGATAPMPLAGITNSPFVEGVLHDR